MSQFQKAYRGKPASRTRRLLSRMSVLVAIASSGLSGCSSEVAKEQLSEGIMPPVVNPVTEINQTLRDLPPPTRKIAVAVYNYADQTGQFKPSETTQTLSKAVTQGATSVLIKALQDVGGGSWFTVVEREKIANLLKERSIITQMRMTYLGEKSVNRQALPPLLFAAIIFEGGIIGYDSNLQTGGVGARLLGIGGDVQYRLDTITIYLRAVSTKTGEVLASVTTHKTIASVGLQGGVFKYIAVDKILEAEVGVTKNEPDQLAVQQAIEKAVYSMVIEGANLGIWAFADKAAQEEEIGAYQAEDNPALVRLAKTQRKSGGAAAAPKALIAKSGAADSTVAELPKKMLATRTPDRDGFSPWRAGLAQAVQQERALTPTTPKQLVAKSGAPESAIVELPKKAPARLSANVEMEIDPQAWGETILEVQQGFNHEPTRN